MTILNGYATLAEFKDRLFQQRTYSAASLVFDAATKTITDAVKGLGRFQAGTTSKPRLITITGSVLNNGTFTVLTSTAGVLTVSEALVNETHAAVLTDVTDQEDDATVEAIITAMSRWIDNYTGRRFFSTSSDETRYFDASDSKMLLMPDILSITSLATDDAGDRTYSTSWVAGDYELEPANASLDGEPYTQIRITPNGSKSFPRGRRTVKIVGKFGYSVSAPALIKEACLLQSLRIFKRKDAPFGVTAVNEVGMMKEITDVDPDVKILLEPFVRFV